MKEMIRRAIAWSSETTTNMTGPSAPGFESELVAEFPDAWCLTILFHPRLERIGAQYWWRAEPGTTLSLSRLNPLFVMRTMNSGPGSVRTPSTFAEGLSPDKGWEPIGALDEPQISRSPLSLECHEAGLTLRPESDRVVYSIAGRPGGPEETLPLGLLRQGVTLMLGSQVTLFLRALSRMPEPETYGLMGVSSAIDQVRHELGRLARLHLPVLITGESGSGKELVARAIHSASTRSQRKMVTVNMSAMPASVAVAQLFGYGKGAFTGAGDARPGLMVEAAGGTLFLDEIGETPLELQPMLLRAIELREIQPLGLPPQSVDVRFLFATDANLQKLVAQGMFRAALHFRLMSTVLHVPPLRERVEDIPLLFLSFLREALTELGSIERLFPGQKEPSTWLRRPDILQLMRHPWMGNVRELKNVAWQLAIRYHEEPVANLAQELAARVHSQVHSVRNDVGIATSRQAPAEPLRLAGVTSEQVRAVLQSHDWQVGQAATELGISRSALYTWMEQLGIRHAGTLTREEIELASESGRLGLQALAEKLQVSGRGLKLRMKQLGMPAL